MIIIHMQANIRMWSAFSTWINVIALNPNKVGSFKNISIQLSCELKKSTFTAILQFFFAA